MSDKIDDGGPAFPLTGFETDPTEGDREEVFSRGMTLRDWFAGMALQGMLAYSYVSSSSGNYHENCTISQASQRAFIYADAMIEARKTTK